MTIFALGINHDSASVDVREKVAFSPAQMQDALQSALAHANLSEVVILSTCNRTEILAKGSENTKSDEILHWLASYKNVHVDSIHQSIYSFENNQAVMHMMRVAAGLNSMVLGEPQILGQMKSAYAVAKAAGTIHSELDRALQHTFLYAKKVRTETAIGENPVSVAFACVHLAQKIFTDLSTNRALLIGAGQTIDLVAKHLLDKNIGSMVVANRTLERANILAEQYGAEAILLGDIGRTLVDVDIIISSTASQLPILGKGAIEKALKKRKHRPMFLIDIAVPRDIEPEVGDLRDAYLYTVDDLKDIIDENKKARQEAAQQAESILEQGIETFSTARRADSVRPYLRAYREQAETISQDVLQKGLKQLAKGQSAEQVLEQVTKQLTNKLIHAPSSGLRNAGEKGNTELINHYIQLLDIDINPLDYDN